MKDKEILEATKRVVTDLLKLDWKREKETGRIISPGVGTDQIQTFVFFKLDGSRLCTVEFDNVSLFDAFEDLQDRQCRITDTRGNLIIEQRNLCSVKGVPYAHPLNDLYNVVWGKKFKGDKFPEVIKLENFTESITQH